MEPGSPVLGFLGLLWGWTQFFAQRFWCWPVPEAAAVVETCPVGYFLLYSELPLNAAWNIMPAVLPSLITTCSFTFITFFGIWSPKILEAFLWNNN